MKIFGLEIRRAEKALHAVSGWRDGWRRIHEPYSGAWQQNVEEKQGTLVCYPTLSACLSAPSQDIGKLPFQLMQREGKVYVEVENPAYSPVLRKPNGYQTAQQFREAWILSKLMHGNTYVLKVRDNRGIVTDLYVLDPCRTMPLVSDSGDVYYQLQLSTSENLLPANYPASTIVVPAREIMEVIWQMGLFAGPQAVQKALDQAQVILAETEGTP